MATTKLSELGENFIKSKCNGSDTKKLQGYATDKRGYSKNPTAVLPYCLPLTLTTKLWKSNPNINGNVKTDGELGEALIRWYNKYAEIYEMDANILAAQAYQESAFIIWNYAVNSSASGISQFIAAAIFDVIVRNAYGGMTNDERIAITKNVNGYVFTSGKNTPKTPFIVDNPLGRENRPILHQNIIDNPEIMIKAQFEYMKWISKRCDGLASSTLFGYSRGPGYVNSSSYPENISASIKGEHKGYEEEGINYVYRIFLNLYTNFGYTKLNMTKENELMFDKFNSNLG